MVDAGVPFGTPKSKIKRLAKKSFKKAYSKLVVNLFGSDIGFDCLITIIEMIELREISIYKVFNNFMRQEIKNIDLEEAKPVKEERPVKKNKQ